MDWMVVQLARQTHKLHHRHGFVLSSFVFSSKSDSTPTPDARSEQRSRAFCSSRLSFSQPPITRTVSNLCGPLTNKTPQLRTDTESQDSSRAFYQRKNSSAPITPTPMDLRFECEETLVAIQVHSCASEWNLTDLTVLAATNFACEKKKINSLQITPEKLVYFQRQQNCFSLSS